MLDDENLRALKNVIDPELSINVVDLGLDCRAEHVSNGIEVRLGMTSPACPLGAQMMEEATWALKQRFPDASSVNVELVRDLPWSPERMSEEGRRKLSIRSVPSLRQASRTFDAAASADEQRLKDTQVLECEMRESRPRLAAW